MPDRKSKAKSTPPKATAPAPQPFNVDPARGPVRGEPLQAIIIDDVRPSTPGGLFGAKATVGLPTTVSADIFRDGHDVLAACVRWKPVDSATWNRSTMAHVGNDRWEGQLVAESVGRHHFAVEAWTDRAATAQKNLALRESAGVATDLDRQEAAQAVAGADKGEPAPDLSCSGALDLWVDRLRAQFGAWYELFPRSEGGLAATAERMGDIAAMGFDIVYLPPIHPIGTSARKGRHNSLTAGPEDPGSPWAIGGPAGGHSAVEPALGTMADFDQLVLAAQRVGLEVALDYALQCSPDHPWVTEHPEWFLHRADGSIRTAENPPKRYEDIYPINFWPAAESDRLALWSACAEILRFWINRGVRIFRVDNPHTKSLAFWAWLIESIRSAWPDVIFLAEAFTRPKMMAKLAEVGFSQSYTYFTWRTTAAELRTYAEEVSRGRAADYMRPNFWPTTPDILAEPLRGGPPSVFALRLVLAALLVPSYGIYRGFEHLENAQADPTGPSEEHFDSEKYRVRPRPWDPPAPLVDLISTVNRVRREHRALAELGNITFHASTNPAILAWSKRSSDGADTVLVVVNLDPHHPAEDLLTLDLVALGVVGRGSFTVTDELSGSAYNWSGDRAYVRLDPAVGPAHVFAVTD
ncbi:MAG: maltotransferase domain-containing protein [Acidimicrobiales bacterium]